MRVVKWLLALLVLLLVLAAVVVWTMPASVAWKLLGPRLPAVQMSDIGGSVWDGHAGQLSVAGQPLGALKWQTEAWPLLHGDVRVRAELAGDAIQGSAIVTRQRDGLIVLRDASVTLPGAVLEGTLGIEGLRLEGSLHLKAREARIRNAWFVALDASGTWRDAGTSGAAEAHLGNVKLEFSEPSPPTILGDIRDDGHGPLLIRGQLKALPTGYTLEAQLRARDPNDLQTQEALRYVGQRQPDGSVLLQAGGQLLLP